MQVILRVPITPPRVLENDEPKTSLTFMFYPATPVCRQCNLDLAKHAFQKVIQSWSGEIKGYRFYSFPYSLTGWSILSLKILALFVIWLPGFVWEATGPWFTLLY